MKALYKMLVLLVFLVAACNKDNDPEPPPEQSISFLLRDKNYLLKSPNDHFECIRDEGNNQTEIAGVSAAGSLSVDFQFFGLATGTYSLIVGGFTVNADGETYSPESTAVTLVVTTYGAAGEFIEGTFQGQVRPISTDTYYPITGSFKVKVP